MGIPFALFEKNMVEANWNHDTHIPDPEDTFPTSTSARDIIETAKRNGQVHTNCSHQQNEIEAAVRALVETSFAKVCPEYFGVSLFILLTFRFNNLIQRGDKFCHRL